MNKTLIENITKYTKNLRVLFIEDDYDSRIQTLKMLENIFSSVITVADGLEGLQSLESGRFDIIFSDINMPNLDGIGFIQQVRKKDRFVPIVMITAYDNAPYMLKCIEEGVDGYLVKPIDIRQFLKVIEKIIEKMNSQSQQKFIFLCGGYYWNENSKKLYGDKDIELTVNETRFLDFMISAKGALRSYLDIDFHLFEGEDYNERKIRNLVSRLRKKIGNEFLESMYGEGYRIKIVL